jgi:putative ABC transport system permease protein
MRRATNAVSFTVSGIVTFPLAAFNKGTVLLPLESAQQLVKMSGGLTEILLQLPDDSEAKARASEIRGMLTGGNFTNDSFTADGAGLEIKDWESIDMLVTFLGLAELIYAVFALIFFLLASTVLINTTMMVVFERTREIGTIGAMGMLGREIVGLFFLEAFFIAALGALGGLALGTAIVLPLQSIGLDFSEAMSGTSINIPGIIYPQYNIVTSLLVTIYSIIVASLAALLPSRKAAQIAPVEALRYQG